jgi:hypothetical protein
LFRALFTRHSKLQWRQFGFSAGIWMFFFANNGLFLGCAQEVDSQANTNATDNNWRHPFSAFD